MQRGLALRHPRNGIDFDMHSCFLSKRAQISVCNALGRAECASCGRETVDDCWAMGAMMEYNSRAVTRHTHLAWVYCATCQAIADFLQPDWHKILQLEVQEVPER
ncbi:hypothetical protein WJX77_010803 [Trebouxia sp. C0004]